MQASPVLSAIQLQEKRALERRVRNKIDLRGGEVTNEALEAEIVPIMKEFKVRLLKTPHTYYRAYMV